MWSINDEINFFKNAINGDFANKEDLFYQINDKYLAYIPKETKKRIPTLQSRNSLIGNYTENWCCNLLQNIAKRFGLYAVNGVVCNELGLIPSSRADLAFCTTNNKNQIPQNIKLIFEIKMSIVNQYEFLNGEIIYLGNHKTHKALPSLTRSDSMLKAIGKSINIKVESAFARNIPMVIIGNTHISDNYLHKVDNLGKSGVLQKVISVNPSIDEIKKSPLNYFCTPNNLNELEEILENILNEDLYYFSSMMSKEQLSQIIKQSSKAKNEIEIAETFLKLLEEKK